MSNFPFPALIYQGILSLNLSAGTRSTIEDFGFFFEPQKAAVSAGRIVRNAYFAWFGRVVFNLLTNPATTMQELTQLRLLEIAWLNKDWRLKKLTILTLIFLLIKCLIFNQIFSGILPLYIFVENL